MIKTPYIKKNLLVSTVATIFPDMIKTILNILTTLPSTKFKVIEKKRVAFPLFMCSS